MNISEDDNKNPVDNTIEGIFSDGTPFNIGEHLNTFSKYFISIHYAYKCYVWTRNQMQTRADAEIVVYSGEIQNPGDQSYEAQNDRQENSQGWSRIKKNKNHQNQKQKRASQKSESFFKGVSYTISQ